MKVFQLNRDDIFKTKEDSKYLMFIYCDGAFGKFLKIEKKDNKFIVPDTTKNIEDYFIFIACYTDIKEAELEFIKNLKDIKD